MQEFNTRSPKRLLRTHRKAFINKEVEKFKTETAPKVIQHEVEKVFMKELAVDINNMLYDCADYSPMFSGLRSGLRSKILADFIGEHFGEAMKIMMYGPATAALEDLRLRLHPNGSSGY